MAPTMGMEGSHHRARAMDIEFSGRALMGLHLRISEEGRFIMAEVPTLNASMLRWGHV